MDGENPLIHLYFIFFIQKISMEKNDNVFEHNSYFSHLFVYNIGSEYVAWNNSKLDIKLMGKYVLLCRDIPRRGIQMKSKSRITNLYYNT